MPKLPVLSPKKIIKLLEKQGFQVDHTTGSHYILYDKVTKLRVVVPYHLRDLPKGTLLSIIKQAGLTKEEFEKLVKIK